MDLSLLRTLVETDAAPGFEQPLAAIIKRELESLTIQIQDDPLGNLICMKEGAAPGPKLLITAHMDEIGMMVKFIDKKGFIRFSYLGGFLDQVVLNQRVSIWTKNGRIPGIIGSKAPHLTKLEDRMKLTPHDQMFIDIGTTSKAETIEVGVRIGDPIVWQGPLIELKGNKICGKSFDNRLLAYILIEVLKQASDFKGTIIGIFTVMEEVGLRGARTSSFQFEPDFAISLDIALAGDYPLTKEEESPIKLGKGPTVMMACGARGSLQGGLITHPKVKELMITAAETHQIPFQREIMEGGSVDGSAIATSKAGIPTGNLGIPTRYAHSPVEVASKEDVEQGIRLLLAVIQDMNKFFK